MRRLVAFCKASWAVAGIAALVASRANVAAAPLPQTQTQNATPPALSTEFEVASIKLNTSSGLPPLNVVSRTLMKRTASAAKNGRYTLQGISATTLSALIQAAYNVKEFQILEGPSWVNSDRYDVDARAPGAATFEQMRPMLQSLLADRFKLALHRDTRKLPVYELCRRPKV
jgi:uncharacterized protein (TIGR03435 family)